MKYRVYFEVEAMTLFQEVQTYVEFPAVENNILDFWEKEKIYEKIREMKKNNEKYVFLEGPPTANGKPHVGHVLTRCLKDLYLRYKTMNGYFVSPLIGGWDCHGLPVEIEIEKKLGLNNKQEIIDYGVKKFNSKCRESAMKYISDWVNMTKRVGFWIDLDNAYITMKDYYIESVWWSLKELWDKGLLIKGHKVVPSCPRCEVTLSSHEYSQGLKETEDPSITIKFSARDEPNTYFLAWTTTPWTLISNVGLAVAPEVDYVKIKQDQEFYYLAKERLSAIFLEEEYEIIEEMKGKDLEEKQYEQLFKYARLPPDEEEKGFRVLTADFVTIDEGTGIVHTAPAFGPEDYELGMQKGLPFLQPVNNDGTFTEEITPWAGMFIKDADKGIIKALRKNDRLVKESIEKHTSGFCWRCKTPTMYYAREAWLIRMSTLHDEILELNEQINWVPSHLKHGRFGDFLDNIVDWALSRERFWGSPLPIWICPEGHQLCIGSVEELKSHMKKELPVDFELHKPWIDEVKVYCPECDKEMTRENFVIDCWYDSGSSQFAQWHYPFENKKEFEEHYPIEFITEAIDQTRGWFYTLLAISTALFNKPAYLNCLSMGHVLDKDGVKMSKHIGNVVEPKEVYSTVGADPMRWYFFSFPVWNPTRFSADIIEDARRRFFGTLWNVYAFFVTNINIDNINPNNIKSKVADRPQIDQWLISKLNSLVVLVRKSMDDFHAHLAVKALEDFVVENLSNWYVRRSRRRFWNPELSEDKKHAYATLYEILVTITKLLAPFTPFASEKIYKNLVRGILSKDKKQEKLSVHFEDYPKKKANLIEPHLEEAMDYTIAIVEAGRAARAKAGIKVRLPLPELIIVSPEPEQKLAKQFLSEIEEELNVKEITFQTGHKEMVDYSFKPKFHLLGPAFKSNAPVIGDSIRQLAGDKAAKAVKQLEQNGVFELETEEGTFTIKKEQVEVISSGIKGYADETFNGGQVFLKTELTSELIEEGLARDVVRRVQSMRKDADLQYTQNIEIYYRGEKEILEAIKKWQDYIKQETLAVKLVKGTTREGYYAEWDIDGKELKLRIVPL
jgi:isoleucyl-tRNA synthetase